MILAGAGRDPRHLASMALVSARPQTTPSSGDPDFLPFPTTVLIADDDPSVRRLLRIAFELDGYRTITAADGDEAVAAVRLHQPDVVIVDAAMPGCTGTAVCRALRQDFGWGPTVIMLTGRTDVADRLAAFECGVDEYLEKPIKISELVERVRLHHLADIPRNSARLLGSVEIYDDLRRRLESVQPVAVVITEIQGLRPFTRHYGFARGEGLVGVVANLLLELARQEPEGLAGRLGAQDFITLVDPARAEGFTASLRSAFDARRPSLYDAVDALRGWIDVTDRMGRTRRHRPVRLTLGVATSEPPHVLHHLDLLERAAELARYARTADGGPVAFDRRGPHRA
jgi:DNA-binding response OmpR family regulator